MSRLPIILAIIPARGGSKGLAGKNIKVFDGKPLIAYSIEAALNCKSVTRCIVSTEDPKIKRLALKYGAETIDRPYKLATDEVRAHEVVVHVLDELKKESYFPDYIILLQPTSPLRSSEHIQDCIDSFLKSGAASAISVSAATHHPYKSFFMKDGLLEPLFTSESLEMRRQALPEAFSPNGAIFLISSSTFLSKKVFYVPPAMPYVMDYKFSIDIDNEVDFLAAETIQKKYINKQLK